MRNIKILTLRPIAKTVLIPVAMVAVLLIYAQPVVAERIKDISHISGIRSNQLVGYGLVVGLDGSGDNSEFTGQSFKTMLSRLGIQLPAAVDATSKNIAAVAIHAELPPFSRPGHTIDVTVSSIGNAKSLRGGSLLLSQLKGVDGNVYAIAQGNLVVGGFGAEGQDGSKIKVNVPVVGRIPNGASIEVASPSTFSQSGMITYLLNRADFTTVKRMVDSINLHMGPGTAMPVDGASINVNVPRDLGLRVKFLATLENLSLSPGEDAAKVIVNSRTGTIVVGNHVMVGPAAVSHGSLTVTITEDINVSQPLPGTEGDTVQTPESDIVIAQPNSKMFFIDKSVSLSKIVNAVNQVGAAPGDLMAILEALKRAGSLSAELEII